MRSFRAHPKDSFCLLIHDSKINNHEVMSRLVNLMGRPYNKMCWNKNKNKNSDFNR